MAISISAIPSIQFIGNPMPVVLTEATANFRRFLYKIEVGGVETEEFEAKRNANNQAIRDISSLLSQFFTKENYPIADISALLNLDIIANSEALCKAYTLYARSQFTNSTPESTTDLSGCAVWGRLNFNEHPQNNFWTAGIAAQDIKILSAKKTIAKTRLSQKEIWYCVRAGNNILSNDIRLAYQITLANGTLDTVRYQNLTDLELMKFSAVLVSYDILIAPLSLSAVPQKYAMWFEKNNGSTWVRASEIRTLVIDQNYTPQMRQYYFRNRLGGMDTIVFKGETEEKINARRSEASRYLAPNYDMPNSSDFIDYVSDNLTYELNSGYLSNYTDYQLFMEFFKSDLIFEMKNNQLLPCKINTKSIPGYRDDKTEPYACKLEIEYLFEN